jgi:hypothetical protein
MLGGGLALFIWARAIHDHEQRLLESQAAIAQRWKIPKRLADFTRLMRRSFGPEFYLFNTRAAGACMVSVGIFLLVAFLRVLR